MIRRIKTKSIPVDLIKVGQRQQRPHPIQIDQMVKSIEQYGLLTPIGVRADGDKFCLVYGATRLQAIIELGWPNILAVVFDGTPEEFKTAELVENLERRHLDKAQRDELIKKLVELRARAMQGETEKELNDRVSLNSFQEPNTHPKTKVEGAKRGRPVTSEAGAKKDIAAQTGQSVRNVQRATSTKPKGEPAPKKNPADRDSGRLRLMDGIKRHLQEISKLLSACDRSDREMIRKNNQPYLDGWFEADGKLRSEIAVADNSPAGGASVAPTAPDLIAEYAAA